MAVDVGKLAFSSGYRYERVGLKSHATFSIAGGGFASTTVTIAHNLGYKPYYKAKYSYDGSKFYQLFAGTASYNIAGNGVQISNISMTNTSLIIFIENFGVGAASGNIYYRIYEEPQL